MNRRWSLIFVTIIFILLVVVYLRRDSIKTPDITALSSENGPEKKGSAVVPNEAEHQKEESTVKSVADEEKKEVEEQGGEEKEKEGGNVVSSCCDVKPTARLNELCALPEEGSSAYRTKEGMVCKCEDYVYCRLVVATAFSSNHFAESTDMFGSVQEKFPNIPIIVYDLGLSKSEVDTLNTYCVVKEVRKFNFSAYPPHVKNLGNFAWKPLVAQLLSKEFEVFIYGDSSFRIIDAAAMKKALAHVVKVFPYFAMHSGPDNIFLTRMGTIKYLKVDDAREKMKSSGTHAGGIYLTWVNEQMKPIFEYWADCGLHTECIDPPETEGTHGCNVNLSGQKKYTGCHRYDQSAINLIMYREFGQENWEKMHDTTFYERVWFADRVNSHKYQVKKC